MNRKELEPIPPGEILLEEFMRPLGLSAAALARAIRVPPNRVSQILAGKRSVSADTALRLGKYFGVSPDGWSCRPTTTCEWRGARPRSLSEARHHENRTLDFRSSW